MRCSLAGLMMAVATLVTCAIFATATGIVGAVVTVLGLLAFPAMLRAGYNIQRAKLEVQKGDTVPRLDNEKAKLALADAEQKLKELEAKIKSDNAAIEADLSSKRRKREKALFDFQRAERGLQNLQLKAPVDGMVNVMPNYRAGGPFGGGEVEFREGDVLQVAVELHGGSRRDSAEQIGVGRRLEADQNSISLLGPHPHAARRDPAFGDPGNAHVAAAIPGLNGGDGSEGNGFHRDNRGAGRPKVGGGSHARQLRGGGRITDQERRGPHVVQLPAHVERGVRDQQVQRGHADARGAILEVPQADEQQPDHHRHHETRPRCRGRRRGSRRLDRRRLRAWTARQHDGGEQERWDEPVHDDTTAGAPACAPRVRHAK